SEKSRVMLLNRTTSKIVVVFVGLSIGCKQTPPSAALQHVTVQELPTSQSAQRTDPQREASDAPHVDQIAGAPVQEPKVEDVEEHKGPFMVGGKTFTVVLHSKRVLGKTDDFGLALASLDIVDATGGVQHHEEFPHALEKGDFAESCSATVNSITGSNGAGLLLATGCLPSAPMSGGPWQILGVVTGKLSRIGKPLYGEGEMGDFVPGKISHIGRLTQILPDELRIRLFTGYFFVSVAIRVNWMEGKLALSQHCFYQTGHGVAECGCEMPVENIEQHREQHERTFARMFTESNEQIGPPAHIVIETHSRVEILAAKVLVTWEERKDEIGLGVDNDVWVKVRIDDKEGWIHTDEDLQSIGLYRAG